MNFNFENGVLTICVSGRIDSNNADQVGKEIDEIIAGKAFNELVIDVDGLEYISSAGLRVVLKLKKAHPNFKIINASTDVYDVFDMTGFAEIMNIEKAYRKFSVDGLEIIGAGAKGTVYRYNADTIIKVYNDQNALEGIKNERILAKQAFVLGLPTCISYDVVKVGDKFGSVFEMLDAASLSQELAKKPENYLEYAKIFAELLKQIHTTVAESSEVPSCKYFPNKWIKKARNIFDASVCDKLQDMVDEVPDVKTLVHMDYHTNNVLMQNDTPLLIDMDTLSKGHPIFELANIHSAYVTFPYKSNTIESFFGFSKELGDKFINAFFDVYFKDFSEEVKELTMKKVYILSILRMINHYIKLEQTDENKACIERGRKELLDLISQVDSLYF